MKLIPRKKGGHWDVEAVLEQLRYWGSNTDTPLMLTAYDVITSLVDERDNLRSVLLAALDADGFGEKR